MSYLLKRKKTLNLIIFLVACISIIWGFNAVLLADVINVAASAKPETLPVAAPATMPTTAQTCGVKQDLLLMLISPQDQLKSTVELIYISPEQSSVLFLAFPSDYPMTISASTQANKITLSEAYSRLIQANSYETTAAIIANMILNTFSLDPDHYLILQPSAAQKSIDAIGGILVYLPEPLTLQQTNLPAGYSVINGETAIAYDQYWYQQSANCGDNGCLAQRSALMISFLQRLQLIGQLNALPQLTAGYPQEIITDLSPQDQVAYACMLANMPVESVKYSAPTTFELLAYIKKGGNQMLSLLDD